MFWLILAGLAAGMLGGMGMGGGTVYIPLLTEVFGVPRHLAQWLNLVAFVPMAALSLVIHGSNGLLDKKGFWWLLVPSAASCIGCSFLAIRTSAKTLSVLFACFLVAMGLWGTVGSIIKAVRDKKSATPIEPPDE